MTRWVIDGPDGLLNARAAALNWATEQRRLQYAGPAGEHAGARVTQVRWLVRPLVGLPANPFVVWRGTHPGGSPSKQELANQPGWEPVEVVGLPVGDDWADTPYSLEKQGPPAARVSPREAALNRLRAGAPPIGWPRFEQNGLALPDWQPPDLNAFLKSVLDGRLLAGVRRMLATTPPRGHDAFTDAEAPRRDSAALPRLILDPAADTTRLGAASGSEWHPLRVLALAAGSDPYAALAFGFGTALVGFEGGENTLLMVTVRHRYTPDGPEFELADVAWPVPAPPAPDAPTGLRAARASRTRPQALDAPALESVGVDWDRPPNPAHEPGAGDAAYPAGYAIGRFGPETWRAELLLTPRPREVGGWLSFVPGRGAGPARFVHHLARTTTVGNPPVVVPAVTPAAVTYAAAAQDLFGRWSHWQTTGYAVPAEPPPAPRVVASRLDPDGRLTADFTWDWSDRSPQFAELTGAFADAPAVPAFTVRCEFAGRPAPAPDVPAVRPLGQNLEPVGTWGAAQDKDPAEPGARYYRLTTTVPLAFAGRPWRDFQTAVRGQCHVHHLAIPGYNVGPFSPPAVTRVFDPAPPEPPTVPEVPQWASLPDALGVSRAVLGWGASADGRAAGYALYEATETAVLAARGLAGPDTAGAFTDRLRTLRGAALPELRRVFRRVEPGLLAGPTYEAALPRGSRVIHLYAITAVTANGVESGWPDQGAKFIAVAAPRLDVPPPPALDADVRADGAVVLRVETRGVAPGGRVEVFRTTAEALAADADRMGPPLLTTTAAPPVTTLTDAAPPGGWRRVWYRAVAWSAGDGPAGLVEARSAASAACPVAVPPAAGPVVVGLRVNEPRSTAADALVSWTTAAPAPADTPLGTHAAVLEARDAAGTVRVRLDRPVPLPAAAALPGPGAAAGAVYAVPDGAGRRFYGWVPRPAGGGAFPVRAKVIDPLGRLGIADATVPPLTADPPEITAFDPSSGGPGTRVVITGRALVLRPGDPVEVRFVFPTEPGAPADPGPFAVVGPTTPTQITADVPAIDTEGHFPLVVVRSDGREAQSGDDFQVTLL